jgi:hypothetical protein
MGKPETSFKKKETKKSPVGIAAVGTFSTYLRPPIHQFTCSPVHFPLLPSSFVSLALRSSSSLAVSSRSPHASSRFSIEKIDAKI